MVDKIPLILSIESRFGTGTKTLDFEHLWAAPFRKTMQEGKPNGTWLYVAINDPAGVPRMLGSFVQTIGNRTLFCPGFNNLVLPISNDDSDDQMVLIDHLTLEQPREINGLKKWSSHIATRDHERNNPRGLNQTSQQKEGWMFPWFSVVLPSFDTLDIFPNKILVPHDSPSSDLPDRPKRTLGEHKAPILLTAAEVPSEDSNYYIQFDVWAGQETSVSHLKSHTFNYVEDKVKIIEKNHFSGQTEFSLIEEHLWLRIMVTIRRGESERACILRPDTDNNIAWLL